MSEQRQRNNLPLAVRGEIGYSIAEVDEFMDRARRAYESPVGDSILTSEQIRAASFKPVSEGYSARYVDAALDRLEEVLATREQREQLRASDSVTWRKEIRGLAGDVASRSVRPRGERFRRRGILASGYKRSQVDALVDRCAAALSGNADIQPAQVREAVFYPEWRGYDEGQVDAFFDAIVELLLADRENL